MYFLLRNYQPYDFQFFNANNGMERPNQNRKVENPPFFNETHVRLVRAGNQLRRQQWKDVRGRRRGRGGAGEMCFWREQDKATIESKDPTWHAATLLPRPGVIRSKANSAFANSTHTTKKHIH